MPRGPRAPSPRDILEVAADFGIELSDDEAATYARLMAPAVQAYRRLEELPERVRSILFTGAYLQRHYHGRYYAKARNVRHVLREDYDAALQNHDLLLMPNVPFRAVRLPPPDHSIEEGLAVSGTMPGNTCQTDVTGHPSMSVPCGMADGLPIGMMITGRHFDDSQVIAAAAAFESLGGWRNM